MLTIAPKWFERGVKKAINIKFHRPTLNRDGGSYNLPAVQSNLLKGRTRIRGVGILARTRTSGNLATLGEVTELLRLEVQAKVFTFQAIFSGVQKFTYCLSQNVLQLQIVVITRLTGDKSFNKRQWQKRYVSITSIFILFQFVCRGEVPRVDFLTDSNGKVITGNNFGLSVFTETDFLPKPLRRGPLWQLDNKTPFPEELGLYFDTSSHGIIAPTQPVTPSTVQKMLRCLHWRKIQSRQSGALQ